MTRWFFIESIGAACYVPTNMAGNNTPTKVQIKWSEELELGSHSNAVRSFYCGKYELELALAIKEKGLE
jgi:hypothetical protein